MTPTEQDKELEQSLNKLSELNKLSGRGHGDLADTCYVCGISPSKLLAYITADRKRVELEARINELNHVISKARGVGVWSWFNKDFVSREKKYR